MPLAEVAAYGAMVAITVSALRRYPVKSMGGEALECVALDGRGLVGDRWYAVEDSDGHFASGKNTRRFRRRDAVFAFTARTSGDEVRVRGAEGEWSVGDPALDHLLTTLMGASVCIRAERDVPHQDMGFVSLVGSATLAWCADRWGIEADPRRLRANVVVATHEPFIEETWAGEQITVGGAELHVVERVPRCRMIDVDQDGAQVRGRWLKPLAAERGMFIAMYADVARPGVIAVGDPVG